MRHIPISLILSLLFFSLFIATPGAFARDAVEDVCKSMEVEGVGSGDENMRTYTAPEGRVITKLCVAHNSKARRYRHYAYEGDYLDDCFQISGLHTNTVTVRKIGEKNPFLKDVKSADGDACLTIDHLDVMLGTPPTQVPTRPPLPTFTPIPSPTLTLTPSPSLMPSTVPPQQENEEINNTQEPYLIIKLFNFIFSLFSRE